MWRACKFKIPLDDGVKNIGFTLPSKCSVCGMPQEEMFGQVFLKEPISKTTWEYFHSHAGMPIENLQLQQVIVKWWDTLVLRRLQPIFWLVPTIILWELWNKRKHNKHGEKVIADRIIYQVSHTLHLLVKNRKPAIKEVPHRWPDIIPILENFLLLWRLLRFFTIFLQAIGYSYSWFFSNKIMDEFYLCIMSMLRWGKSRLVWSILNRSIISMMVLCFGVDQTAKDISLKSRFAPSLLQFSVGEKGDVDATKGAKCTCLCHVAQSRLPSPLCVQTYWMNTKAWYILFLKWNLEADANCCCIISLYGGSYSRLPWWVFTRIVATTDFIPDATMDCF